jgi:NUMOD3 motif
MTPDELQNLILDHLKRSSEPVSDLGLQHRLEYENPTVAKQDVTYAVNRLVKLGQLRVASFVTVECERQDLLELNPAFGPTAQKDPVAREKPVVQKAVVHKAKKHSDEYRKKLSEAHRGRSLSEAHRRAISEGHRRRHAERLKAAPRDVGAARSIEYTFQAF